MSIKTIKMGVRVKGAYVNGINPSDYATLEQRDGNTDSPFERAD